MSSWPASGFSGTLPGGIGVMVMAMMTNERMTNERKIWEAALLLVRRHGAEAALVAQREAQRLRRNDDELTCVVWCWIARSTAELLRPVPDKGERVH
ncbi:MAG TPA: hypothetical protein VGR45_12230 [Stellaceae bacterium]|nr:hypothetical protein [Stellaceae bacterium]